MAFALCLLWPGTSATTKMWSLSCSLKSPFRVARTYGPQRNASIALISVKLGASFSAIASSDKNFCSLLSVFMVVIL